jgi:SulP family sulfate permease
MLKKLLSNCSGDIMGGMMTAVVALPVAMAFGLASGLGAAAGMYGAMCCGLFASLFGGTKGQQSGPTGPVAVMIATLIADSSGNLSVVFAAIILGGIFQIVAGKLGWGDLVRYLPYPVVSGFMTGIALIIVLIHVNPFFGIKGSKQILETLSSFPEIPNHMNMSGLGIAILTLLVVYGLRFVSKKLPASLLALVVATIVSVVMKLDIPRIGEIPSQLPIPSLPMVDISMSSVILSGAVTIALLGSIDSLLTSLIADKILRSNHDSNKELVGQGIGNIAAGLMGGMAGAGSTTRTLANIDAGGRTALSGIVYSAIILCVITGLGKVAALIPMSSLAAILIVLGIGIVDWRSLKHMTKAPRSDVIVMSVVLFMTVFIDLISAVLLGMALASVLFVKKITDVHLADFVKLEAQSELAHLIDTVPDDALRQSFVYTFNGPIFFGETKNLSRASKYAEKADALILNFQHAHHFIDQSCCYFLEDMVGNLRSAGKLVLILGLEGEIKNGLESMDCNAVLSREFQLSTWAEVVQKIQAMNSMEATASPS